MKNKKIVIIAVVVCLVFAAFTLLFTGIGVSNREIRLRNQITASQRDNQNEFDLMWKKIAQVTQVTQAERSSVERIILEYAQARTSSSAGTFVNAVREVVPTMDSTAFTNLQNILVAYRDRFATRQTRLLDLKREHDDILMTFPGSLFVGGRAQIDVQIVTSGRTQETFVTGEDNDVDLGFTPSSVEK